MKRSNLTCLAAGILTAATLATGAQAANVSFCLPERFRLLTEQMFDLRIEATDLQNLNSSLVVKINGVDVTSSLPAPEVTTDNDNQPASLDKAWTFRNLSIIQPGVTTIEAVVETSHTTQRIGVQAFNLHGNGKKFKNIILYIGDAMGTAYRDTGRIVGKSTGNRFREGFFDELQQMDSMPISGMVMTYAENVVAPDSANTASAWASGNKTIDGALNTQPDNDDFRFSAANTQGTKQFALNNPRIETLWEYLKRLYGYKTGIITTADVTDATPAGEGGHTILRSLGFDIARQYVDGVFTSGATFDVIMGGGKERFNQRTLANSGDTRDLIAELQGQGFASVGTRTALNALPATTSKIIGLFRTGNMNVTYDKLGLTRDQDEPAPNFGGFADQPFLDEMTKKAVAALSRDGAPFILMVEGASVDKESHPNNANGMVWDVIELDKAIGVGRAFAAEATKKDSTLLLVTADHDQSLHIIGVGDAAMPGAILNTHANSVYPATKAPFPPAAGPFFPFAAPPRAVAPSNSGNNIGEVTGFPDYADANGDGYPENLNQFRIVTAFRTGNHTGSCVPITAEGPGALQFTGYFDQTDIFFKMARTLSDDTKTLDDFLKEKARLQTISPNY
jgi:alkaline phosphatase